MIFGIAKWIASIFGLDITKVQKFVLLAVMIIVVVAVIAACLWIRSCAVKHSAKIAAAQVDKINKADEKERKAELQTVITQNADVVKTVDQRNTIAASDETQKNAEIYLKIQEVDSKIADAKANGHDVTGPELDCMLTGVCS